MLNQIIEELGAMDDLFVPDEALTRWKLAVSESDLENKQEIISLLNQAGVQLLVGKPYSSDAPECQILGVVTLKEKLTLLKWQS